MWTTAHARRHHQNLIDAFGDEFIYGDTDSAKGTDVTGAVHERIRELNKAIMKECDERKAVCVLNGHKYYMGIFVEEAQMTDFRTMGAKKYAYTDMEGKLHVTVAGVTKGKGAEELEVLDNFKPGFCFKEAGGLEMRYHDYAGVHTLILKDDKGIEHRVLSGSSVSAMDSTYTLGYGNDYGMLLESLRKETSIYKGNIDNLL